MSNELDVEILAIGTWNNTKITMDDLKSIEIAFNRLGEQLRVPLKFGHNEEQPMTDGQPSLGWVSEVWISGKKLMAKFTDIPDLVFKSIEKKLYRNVSVELLFGVEHKEDYYSAVLSGVALLGADIPAVNTLADLQAYMSNDLHFDKQAAFSTTPGNLKKEDSKMSKELEEKLAKAEAEAAKFKAEKEVSDNKLAAFKAEQEAKEKARLDDERKAKFASDKTAFASQLDQLVKDHVMTPAQREELTKNIDSQDDLEKAQFAASFFSKKIDDVDDKEKAKNKTDAHEDEDGLRPDQIILKRANEIMLDKKVDFTTAQEHVLRTDIKLAKAWAEQNGSINQ